MNDDCTSASALHAIMSHSVIRGRAVYVHNTVFASDYEMLTAEITLKYRL